MAIARSELLCWSLALALLLLALLLLAGPAFYSDSYQYLSVADHLRTGEGIRTSLVHFDVERAHGTIPAPVTTFPPGYPLAIAFLSLLGLSLTGAAVLCSAMAALSLVPVVAFLGGQAGLSAWATRLSLFLLVLNAVATRFGTTGLSEPLFALLTCATLAVLAVGEELLQRNRFWLLLISGALAGLCYGVRYAGLFLIVAVALFHAVRAVTNHPRHVWTRVLSLCTAGLVMAPILSRNVALTGSWKGGNTKLTHNAFTSTVKMVGQSVYHLLFGPGKVRVGPGELLFACGVLLMLVLTILLLRTSVLRFRTFNSVLMLLVLYAVTYVALFTYAGLVSVITISPRAFYPILPVLVILVGAAFDQLTSAGTWAMQAAWVAVLAGYAILNLNTLRLASPDSTHLAVEERLESPYSAGGGTIRNWVDQHVNPGAVIAAACGQATGYVLDRKTVSLVDRQYSDEPWDKEHTLSTMDHFGAQWLVVYPALGCAFEEQDWPFLDSLARGKGTEGLDLALDSPGVRIYRRHLMSAN
jgi:hypothetical protein